MMQKWNIKVILKELLMGAVAILILSNIISYIRQPELSSNMLSHIEAKLLNGTDYRVNKSKPLVLHFWATWCSTCKLEIGNFEYISKEYEVLTIAVNSGDNKKLKSYLKEKGFTFPVVNDSRGEWAKRFKIEVYPTTFIYDGNGELRFTEVGYTTTAGLLARLALTNKYIK